MAKVMTPGVCGRLIAACIAVGALTSRAASAADFAAADAVMVGLMSSDHIPGAALALILDGRIVLEKGYGFRDLTTHAPVTTATLFNIGSISKSFTALGIAQLADRRQVALDAPVARYIPDLRLSDPNAVRTMTLRQLLSHSSGMPADAQWPDLVPSTREGIAGEFASMPIAAPPGTRFQYCTRCIVLAACILEHVTGESWEAYTREEIFVPLEMTTASFGPYALAKAPDRARPYRHDAVFGDVPVAWDRLRYLDPLAPGGGINASIDQMARYALLQVGTGTIAGHRLVSAPMLAELHRPEIAVGDDWTPGATRENMHYALGWFTADRHGARVLFHFGSNPGFRAVIAVIPSAKAGVVVLANGDSDHFTSAAMRTLIERYFR